ncbi:MAG TPA: FAD-dependent oxidoreductase [Candidatus Acidoferrum sp.]|jgi:ferredoxin-NADP reductase|nr:FAD-dependent oxidoreductase [Candidatus Acidoferrum sp.]
MPYETQSTHDQQLATGVIGYPSRLLGRTEVAKDTTAFQFERPNNFLFRAGQSVDLILLGAGREPQNQLTHTFSIAGDPSDDEIMVVTRMRDTAFKRRLSSLPIGAEVRIDGPRGSFTLHNNTARPAVLLAGGIGIAPFLSMVYHARKEGLRHRIILFYANRFLEDAAFIDALWKMERTNPRFSFVPTLTGLNRNPGDWKGETGHISPQMLSRRVGKLQGPIFYIAGPPSMVAAARSALVEAAVDDDDIRTEEFAGY